MADYRESGWDYRRADTSYRGITQHALSAKVTALEG